MEKRRMTCINCPLGCSLEVDITGESINVSGNRCKGGEKYGRSEVLNPKRIVTSTISVIGGERPLISVKTDIEIPKGKIFDLMEVIKNTKVNSPVEIGDIIIENVLETGANIIATSRG